MVTVNEKIIKDDVDPIVNDFINKGYITRQGDVFYLTPEGRTQALMRWRGLCSEIKVLIALWLREVYDKDKKGE